MINKNLPRWIRVSAMKYFIDQLTPQYPTFCEGMDADTKFGGKSFIEQIARIEVRMDGPQLREFDSNRVRADIEMNFTCTVQRQDGVSIWKLDDLIGAVVASFGSGFQVFKYGDGPDDDGAALGCMQLDVPKHTTQTIHYFGQIEPRQPLMQATVDGHFTGLIDQ